MLGTNAAVYSLLYFNIRTSRKRITASSLPEAFHALEKAIRESVPDLPAGFTWGEALNRLRTSGKLDLGDVENALRVYEAHRYGGLPLGSADYRTVLKVANWVSETKFGSRS